MWSHNWLAIIFIFIIGAAVLLCVTANTHISDVYASDAVFATTMRNYWPYFYSWMNKFRAKTDILAYDVLLWGIHEPCFDFVANNVLIWDDVHNAAYYLSAFLFVHTNKIESFSHTNCIFLQQIKMFSNEPYQFQWYFHDIEVERLKLYYVYLKWIFEFSLRNKEQNIKKKKLSYLHPKRNRILHAHACDETGHRPVESAKARRNPTSYFSHIPAIPLRRVRRSKLNYRSFAQHRTRRCATVRQKCTCTLQPNVCACVTCASGHFAICNSQVRAACQCERINLRRAWAYMCSVSQSLRRRRINADHGGCPGAAVTWTRHACMHGRNGWFSAKCQILTLECLLLTWSGDVSESIAYLLCIAFALCWKCVSRNVWTFRTPLAAVRTGRACSRDLFSTLFFVIMYFLLSIKLSFFLKRDVNTYYSFINCSHLLRKGDGIQMWS